MKVTITVELSSADAPRTFSVEVEDTTLARRNQLARAVAMLLCDHLSVSPGELAPRPVMVGNGA